MNGKRMEQSQPIKKPPRAPTTDKGERKRRAQARKRKRIIRIIITVLAVLLTFMIGVIAIWKAFAERPSVNQFDPDSPSDVGNLSDIGDPVRVSGDRKKDFFTFLIIGRDTGGGGNTDTVLLAAYDLTNQELNVMSIPRDTMVNVSWDIKKINSVYNMYGGGDKGIEALGKEMAQLVGFVPDIQVILEWKALGELVDALGGVTYDVPRNMYYHDPGQDLLINIKKGTQRLNGSQAMQVVRFRDGPNGYANGDLGRIETQQGFLKAVVEQCLSIGNMTRIKDMAKVFTENVTTNLTMNNLVWFADKAIFGGLKMDNVNFYTMPCKSGRVWSRSYHQKLSYVVPQTDELVALVNERFNPYLDDLKSYELDIMYVNSDGTIGSSTGKLEDNKANTSVQQASSRNSSTTKDEEDSGTETESSKDSSSKIEESNPKKPDETETETVKPPVKETPDDESEVPDAETPDETQVPEGETPEETEPSDSKNPDGKNNAAVTPEAPEPVPPTTSETVPLPPKEGDSSKVTSDNSKQKEEMTDITEVDNAA